MRPEFVGVQLKCMNFILITTQNRTCLLNIFLQGSEYRLYILMMQLLVNVLFYKTLSPMELLKHCTQKKVHANVQLLFIFLFVCLFIYMFCLYVCSFVCWCIYIFSQLFICLSFLFLLSSFCFLFKITHTSVSKCVRQNKEVKINVQFRK